ncbi:hypothetical protein M9H77_17756 [Catharanthus roseus]|uniref:Uncharacterized protein n=1 Tax=Catharanthus roseus TaxID=4058 RepID=A0ACC0B5J8_CATRO|nr:hypothetical protein M9H77_17756 [Catharanthus roseus]
MLQEQRKRKVGTLLSMVGPTSPIVTIRVCRGGNGPRPTVDGTQVILEFNSRVLVLFPNPSLSKGADFCKLAFLCFLCLIFAAIVIGISNFASQRSQGSSCTQLHLGREIGSQSIYQRPKNR